MKKKEKLKSTVTQKKNQIVPTKNQILLNDLILGQNSGSSKSGPFPGGGQDRWFFTDDDGPNSDAGIVTEWVNPWGGWAWDAKYSYVTMEFYA